MGNVNDCKRYSKSTEDEAQSIVYSSAEHGQIEAVPSEQDKMNSKNRRQRNLKETHNREVDLQNTRRICARNNKRFQYSTTAVRTFNVDTEFRGCDFIVDWYKWITNGTLKIDKSKIVDLTINGILTAAKSYSDDENIMKDTNRFVEELRKIRRVKEFALIQEVCVRFYTEDSFFYRIVNETLRNNDRTKFDTMGPLCYLLYNYAGSSNNKQGKLPEKITLYRGERLASDATEQYKSTVGNNIVWRWTQFVSTSKNRSVAEEFSEGNILYIIEMKQRLASDQGVCIASLSEFTMEDEVLLRPGIRFKIMKIEEGKDNQRQIFHIDIIPSYMSGLN